MEYDEHLRRHLRGSCPPGAKKLMLFGDVDSPNAQRYPNEGYFSFWQDFHLDVPNGRYLCAWFTENENPIKTPSPRYLTVQRTKDESRSVADQGSLTAHQNGTQSVIQPEHLSELSAIEVNLRAATAEFQKHKMVVAMQKDAIGLSRASRHTRELQEQANLNQTYRIEMAAMAETHSNITRRHVEHSAKMIEVLGTTSEMLGTVVANMQRAAAQIGQSPPPSPNYSEAIVKGIGMVGGLALQLVAAIKGTPPPKIEESSDDYVEAGQADKKAKAQPARETRSAGAPGKSAAVAIASKDDVKATQGPEPKRDAPPKPPPAPIQPPPAPVSKAAVKSPPPAPPIADESNEADDPEVELILEDLADDAQTVPQALPLIPEGQAKQSAVDFFQSPQNSKKLDALVDLLKQFENRGELEQVLALNAPHLIKRSS